MKIEGLGCFPGTNEEETKFVCVIQNNASGLIGYESQDLRKHRILETFEKLEATRSSGWGAFLLQGNFSSILLRKFNDKKSYFLTKVCFSDE